VEEPVKLLRGAEYLTDDGTIELLPNGMERMKNAHAAGRNVLIEVDGCDVLLEASGVPACFEGGSMGEIQCCRILKDST
jgi:hypothetical protein